ncbi:MAG: hypothetical protein CVU84_07840 [Firmicutes bacterium HGW-Firmicutes-1]|jgi:hypothetical protein|nr:MAG: hypothetical protein CVU84_07840 [Firmicutes bacterium HGW-Firmicutes-1]
MLLKSILREFSSIISMQFMIMMVIIALILIFHDSPMLEKKGATKDSKMAKFCGVVYLILGVSLYFAAKIVRSI